MKTYLNNITNVAVNSVYPNYDSEQDDDTSIRETITIQDNNNNNNKVEEKQNYQIHQINHDEKVEEIDNRKLVSNSNNNIPIEGSTIAILVEKNPDIQDFDETVAIVDSVVIDHVSEDDKSTSSEEVTYERWTEETKIFATKVYKDGELVDEIIQQTSPELVGNILREKLIERHEHIKHISQDVKKLVKVKSPGQSRRQSLNINEIMNETVAGSSIIIVEPTSKSLGSNNIGTTTNLDNTYYIQHQQIITPGSSSNGNQAKITGKHSYFSATAHNSNASLSILNTSQKNNESFIANASNLNIFVTASTNLDNTTSAASTNSPPTIIHKNELVSNSLMNNNNNQNMHDLITSLSLINNNNHNSFYINNNSNSKNDTLISSLITSSSISSSMHNLTKSITITTATATTDLNLNNLLSNNNNNESFYINKDEKHQEDEEEEINNTVTTKSKLRLKDSLKHLTTFDDEDNNENKFELPKKSANQDFISNISTYYGGLEARTILNNNADEEVLIINKNNSSSNDHLDDLDSLNELLENNNNGNRIIDIRSESPNNDIEKRNELMRSQFYKITQASSLDSLNHDSGKNEDPNNKSSETSDSLESMERFERPSKQEMKLQYGGIHDSDEPTVKKQSEEDSLASSAAVDHTSSSSSSNGENKNGNDLNFSVSFEQKLANFKLEMQQNQSQIDQLNQDLLNSKVDLNKLILKDDLGGYYSDNYAGNSDNHQQLKNKTPTDSISVRAKNDVQIIQQSPAPASVVQIGNEVDVTDVSDDEHNNIFGKIDEEPKLSQTATSSHTQIDIVREQTTPMRNFPLRRESFEMAQNQDSTMKRLSISALAAAVSSSSNKSTTSSSSSTSSTSSLSQQQAQSTANQKRHLSEIKPKTTSPISPNDSSSSLNKKSTILSPKTTTKLAINNEDACLIKNKKDFDDSIENDGSVCSDETSTNILERNYELIKRKTTEKLNLRLTTNISTSNSSSLNNQLDSAGPALAANSLSKQLNNEDDNTNQTTSIYENLITQIPSVPSFVSSHSIKSLNRSINNNNNNTQDELSSATSSYSNNTPLKNKSNRIKIVKKQSDQKTAANNSGRYRSISPSLLKRGPDIIETIETTTSMSFIMNKNINLVLEEKRVPLTQQEQEPVEILPAKPVDQQPSLKATPIPITVQSRSKSENPPFVNFKPVCQVVNDHSPRISFHKYDSNEIIAVVNVPQQTTNETTTLDDVINNHRHHAMQLAPTPQFPTFQNKRTSDFIYQIDNTNHTTKSNLSKSVPNLNGKLDTWCTWPEYAVEQDTDSSMVSSTHEPTANIRTSWIKDQITNIPKVEFEIEIEKRPNVSSSINNSNITNNNNNNSYETHTSVSVDGQPVKARVYANQDGGISIENVAFVPGNEIIIESDINFQNGNNNNNNNKRMIHRNKNWLEGRYSANNMTIIDQETIATRMSSGYFSGDEFRSYYNNYEMNCSNFYENSSFNPNNNSQSSLNDSNPAAQFNINKFLNNNKKNKYKKDAIDELNKLYNSLGLEEDEALYETANSFNEQQNYSNIRRVPITTIGKNDPRYRRSQSTSNRLNELQYFNNTNNNNNTIRSSNQYYQRRPDTIKDDMAARRNRVANNSNNYSNTSDLNRYDSSSFLSTSNLNNNDNSNLMRDDASLYNIRKRSNSCTSLNHDTSNPLLILPSPTCADYLRNKTRESALINVVMNPIKTSTDYELSQILYDDMAFRQLRKDSEAHKLSQIKTSAAGVPPPYNLIKKNIKKNYIIPPAENMINITTLPGNINYNSTLDSSNFDYFNNNSNFESYETASYEKINNESFNSISSTTNQVKTVKMIKQKDKHQKMQNNYINSKNLSNDFNNKGHPLFENPNR